MVNYLVSVETMSTNSNTEQEESSARKRSTRKSIFGLFNAENLRNKFKQKNEKSNNQPVPTAKKQDKLDHSFLTDKRKGSSNYEEIELFQVKRKARRSSTFSTWSRRSKRSSSVFSIDREVYESLFDVESCKSQCSRITRDSTDYSALSASDGNNCIICLSQETTEKSLISLPCSNKCNKTFVHLLCIYEWKMKSKDSATGTCPLCRSKLTRIDYTPPDLLKLKDLSTDKTLRRDFALSSIPRSLSMIKAYVKVTYPTVNSNYIKYELFLQEQSGCRFNNYPFGTVPTNLNPEESDVCILTAFKCKLAKFPFRSHFRINLSENRERYSFNWTDRFSNTLMGFVRHSGLLHLSFRTLAVKNDSATELDEVGLTVFAQNRTGEHRGPRKIRVALCAVTKDKSYLPEEVSTETGDSLNSCGKLNARYKPVSTESSLGHVMRDRLRSKHIFTDNFLSQVYAEEKFSTKGLFFGKNKDPTYMEEIGGYSLDFNGRVTLPSNKNFQLLLNGSDQQHNDKISLQFGKVDQSEESAVYTLDLSWPFSPIQAFGVALCSCDWKLGCS